MTPETPTARDWGLALLLCAGTAVVLGMAQRDEGVMRDEATYFEAAKSYWGWFAELGDNLKAGRPGASFTAKSIARYWGVNNEHPALFKTLAGASWRLFHPTGELQRSKPAQLLPEIDSFRVPGWLFAGLCVALIYLFGVRIESRMAGLAAALLYITIPRLFFNGQLCAFDSPVATMWLLVVYAYYRSLSEARWGLYAGLLFGLALATKHNAWFIAGVLLVHYLIVVLPDLSLRPLQLPRLPLAFLAMAVLGPLVFYAHWPWLWFDTVAHLKSYFAFHLHHSYYNIEYLGQNLSRPPLPMSYPFVMTLFTVPAVLIVLALLGLWFYARGPLLTQLSQIIGVRPPSYDSPFRYPARRSWTRPGRGLDPRLGWLCLLNALFPLVLIALPSTPKFGGTKHWLAAYPFFALLGGVALSRLLQHSAGVIRLACALLVALPGAINIAQTHPFGLSQYNALAGGPAGGADLGLNRQFWGYPLRQLLPWINKHCSPNARLYLHDTNYDSYRAYVRDGLLRPDIRDAGMERAGIDGSDYAMVFYELHFNKYDYWIWDAYGAARPSEVLTLDGVPLLSIYQRPQPPPKEETVQP